MAQTPGKDRLLNDKPWRHYRRRYSTTEAKAGLVVAVGLGAIAGWVAWRGAHPDPELFAAAPPQAYRAPGAQSTRPEVLPADLAPAGWKEGAARSFGPEDVYEKINGREGYYKAFGFQALHFVALTAEDDPTRSVDIEVYDQGTAENALGAFAGELPSDASPEWSGGGFVQYTSNALFMTRGRYYVRALGSDRSDAVRALLERLAARFADTLPAGELPPAYRAFAAAFGLGPGQVSFINENAFSIDGANGLWVGLLSDEETEVFVAFPRPGDGDDETNPAETRSARLRDGFGAYGEPFDGAEGWFEDRYLSRVSTARARAGRVVGVRGADDVATGEALLERWTNALGELGPEGSPTPTAPPNRTEPPASPADPAPSPTESPASPADRAPSPTEPSADEAVVDEY